MKNNVMMTVTFADGQCFHRLIDGKTIDDKGQEFSCEAHPEHFDDVVTTFTPNAVVFDTLDRGDKPRLTH